MVAAEACLEVPTPETFANVAIRTCHGRAHTICAERLEAAGIAARFGSVPLTAQLDVMATKWPDVLGAVDDVERTGGGSAYIARKERDAE